MNTKLLTTAAVLAFSLSTGAQASLVARTGGMVYDTVKDITWAPDANLFKTQAASNANLVDEIIAANDGVIYNLTSDYLLDIGDFDTTTGKMTWFGAQAWVNNLNLGGYTGWSLPSTADAGSANYGYNITTSQMGDLFYNKLGGVSSTSIATTHNNNYDLFTNVQSNIYWSGSEYAAVENYAWNFDTRTGYQSGNGEAALLYAWAVRPGDVAAVPVPGAFWLFGTAMVGLMGLKRRKNIA